MELDVRRFATVMNVHPLSGVAHKTPLLPLWEHAQTFNLNFLSVTILFPTGLSNNCSNYP